MKLLSFVLCFMLMACQTTAPVENTPPPPACTNLLQKIAPNTDFFVASVTNVDTNSETGPGIGLLLVNLNQLKSVFIVFLEKDQDALAKKDGSLIDGLCFDGKTNKNLHVYHKEGVVNFRLDPGT